MLVFNWALCPPKIILGRYCEKPADKRIKCVLGDQSYLCIEGSRIELDYQVSFEYVVGCWKFGNRDMI